MNTLESIEDLYNLFAKLQGPIQARELVTSIIGNVICDIQEEGLHVTAEELDKRIVLHIQDYLDVAEKSNVA